jgi:hypothetical protein
MGMKKLKKLVRNAFDIQSIAFAIIRESTKYDGRDSQKTIIKLAKDACDEFKKTADDVVKEFANLSREEKFSPGLNAWLREKFSGYDGPVSDYMDVMYGDLLNDLKLFTK